VDSSRLLVVGDDAEVGKLLTEALTQWGYQPTLASSGGQALGFLKRQVFEAAILDIGMPGSNGYDVARALRTRHGGGVTLVALTGWGQEADRRRASEAGFDHHLIKPVDPNVLNSLLADVANK